MMYGVGWVDGMAEEGRKKQWTRVFVCVLLYLIISLYAVLCLMLCACVLTGVGQHHSLAVYAPREPKSNGQAPSCPALKSAPRRCIVAFLPTQK